MNIEEIKNAFEYDHETGIIRRASNSGRCWKKGQKAGYINSEGYLEIKFHGRVYQGHRIAWALQYGEQPPEFLDHINRDRSDNRIVNLRPATKSQNGANRVALSNNKHGVKGCYWIKKTSSWRVQCRVNKKLHNVGYFKDLNEARAAYTAFAKANFGTFHVPA